MPNLHRTHHEPADPATTAAPQAAPDALPVMSPSRVPRTQPPRAKWGQARRSKMARTVAVSDRPWCSSNAAGHLSGHRVAFRQGDRWAGRLRQSP